MAGGVEHLYSASAVPETALMAAGVETRSERVTSAHVRATLLRVLLWLLLGTWIGSWLCFALVVAPTAFRVLPSTHVAGTLVAPVLDALHLYGVAAGVGLAALAAALHRGRLRGVLPLVMAAACLYSQFGVSAEMAEIRDQVFGPQGSELLAARFNQLHRVSMSIYSAILVGALALLGLHASSEASPPR
jgi:hypothetical protein